LQQNLQLDVERLDSVAVAPPADSKLAPNFNENLLSLVTAYGLAVQGMGEAKVESSLLPAKIRREKMWKEKTKWFAAAAALFCVGTGLSAGSWYVHHLQFKSKESVQAEIDRIKAEGTRLSGEWQSIQDAGGPERQRILNIRSTEKYRTLWGDLMADIVAALPTPQKEVLDPDPEVVKKIPRSERELVSIDRLEFRYVDNLQPMLQGRLANFASLFGMTINAPPAPVNPTFAGEFGPAGEPPPDPNAPPGPNAPRGFLVMARLTTPHKSSSKIVNDTFVANLLKIKPAPGKPPGPYAIVKAEIVGSQKIMDDQTRMSQMKTNYDQALRSLGLAAAPAAATPFGGSGFGSGVCGGEGRFGGGGLFGGGGFPTGGGWNPSGTASTPEDNAAFLDRQTGEDVRHDSQVTVFFVVQLDPPAPPPPAPQASAGQ
ncbi:MAG: hypothetical protein RMJ35_12975, partial [Phycisphaerales bacterium]|nr:hypothetical protein [Phycisphaerales bacterium]